MLYGKYGGCLSSSTCDDRVALEGGLGKGRGARTLGVDGIDGYS